MMLLTSFCVNAQTIDTIHLKAISIISSTYPKYNKNYQLIDSSLIGYNSYLVLNRNANIFIKNYGASMLSSISVQGSNANQTQINFEGLPLNNPLVGIYDLSLLPSIVYDNAQLMLKSANHNASGGNLYYYQAIPNDLHCIIDYAVGSYDYNHIQSKLQFSKNNWMNDTRLFMIRGNEDFKYKNAYHQMVTNTNASYKQYGLLQSIYYTPSTKIILSSKIWLQIAERNIPPTIFQLKNNARQNDTILHSINSIKYKNTTFNYNYSDEKIQYLDVFKNINSRSKAIRNHMSFSFTKNYKKLYLDNAITYQNERAKGQHYYIKAIQHSVNIKLSGNTIIPLNSKNKIKTEFQISETFFNNEYYSAGNGAIQYNCILNLNSILTVQATINKYYRQPTINDRFWENNINKDLVPEQGWGQSLEFALEKNIPMGFNIYEPIKIISLTMYHKNNINYIQWIPTGGWWIPQNIPIVINKGIEINAKYKMKQNLFYFAFNSQSAFNNSYKDSKTEKTQLIYTPKFRSTMSLQFSYKKNHLEWQSIYNSKIYTSSDNTQFLTSYFIHNASVGHTIPIKNDIKINIGLTIGNIFNRYFQTVAGRMMTPRNFQLFTKIYI